MRNCFRKLNVNSAVEEIRKLLPILNLVLNQFELYLYLSFIVELYLQNCDQD